MSASHTIKTRCPVCQVKYRLPADRLGHRARCRKCRTVFRVAELIPPGSNKPHIPTEAEILAWLNEDVDQEDIAVRPRIIEAPRPRKQLIPENEVSQSADEDRPSMTSKNRISNSESSLQAKEMPLRNTG